MSYDSANLAAPVYNSSIMPFPSSPTSNDVPLEMTVQPTAGALNDSYIIWVRIVVQQDTAVQYHVNLTVNVLPRYAVEISAQNNETNVVTPINTDGNYTLIIKNLGNTNDRIYISATGDYTSLVTFDTQYILLGPGQSAFVICRVYTDQATVEANNLYQTGIPSTIRASSENDTNEFATVTLDTDITVTHAHSLSSPDSEKDARLGDTADFLLYIENTGTTGDKYVASVVAFNTSALDNPTFDLVNPFPSSQVAAGTSTTLHVFVDVFDQIPSVPIGGYNITIRISIDGFPAIYKDFTYLVNVMQVYSHTLEAVDDSKEADVDETVNYTVTVKNTGNGPETFTIRATGDYSSLVTFSLTEVTLNQSEQVDIDVQVFTDQMIIDRDDLYGTDLTTPIEVVSKNDPDSFSVEIPINTRIKLSYAFEFTSPQTTKQGEPSDMVQFTLQIRNTGTAADSYNFFVTSIDDTIFTAGAINSINNLGVDTYGTTTVTFTITPEKDKALEGTYDIQVTAQSQQDPGVSISITLKIEITPVGDVEVTPPVQSDSGEPGDFIDYTVRISNRGNAQDTFDLTLEGSYKDWGQILDYTGTTPITQVQLESNSLPGSFSDIIVRVTIPGTGETNAGQTYDIILTAHSWNTEGISDTATLSTTVDQFVELALDYSGSMDAAMDYNPNKSPPKFTFKVTNNGNVPEDTITVNVDGMPATWNYIEPVIDLLEPGKSGTFSLSFEIPSDEEDDGILEVYVTSSDGLYDSDHVTIRINIIKPNLYIDDVMGLDDLDNLKGRVGSAVSIGVVVYNSGTAKAENVQVKLYDENTVIGTKVISSIDPGEYKDVNFRWTAVADLVELDVEVTPMIETDETDNEYKVPTIDLRPDLKFKGEKLTFSISDPTPDDDVTIRAFVENTGGNAENVTVIFYQGTTAIGSDTIDIEFDEVGEAWMTWNVPELVGETVTIRAKIDHSGSKGDGDGTSKNIVIMDPIVEPELELVGNLVADEGETFSYTVSIENYDPQNTYTFADNTELFDINPTTGNITFKPSGDDVGTHVVTITVTDDEGRTDSTTTTFRILEKEETTDESFNVLWIPLIIALVVIMFMVGYFLGGKGKAQSPLNEETEPEETLESPAPPPPQVHCQILIKRIPQSSLFF
jgi:uncharacterized membrane protein